LEVDDETISSFAKKDISRVLGALNVKDLERENREKLACLLAFVSEVIFFSLSSTSLSVRQFRAFKEELCFESFERRQSPCKKVKL
jgi:hypothetical protein